MMEAVSSSKTSVNIYQTTQCNIPEGSHLHTCHCKNLKSHQVGPLFANDNLFHSFDYLTSQIKKPKTGKAEKLGVSVLTSSLHCRICDFY
jgi:hypothetical protein